LLHMIWYTILHLLWMHEMSVGVERMEKVR
jgi:hypothetical protein